MTFLCNVLSAIFFLLPLQDGKKFMIMDLNSSYVVIDSKVMQENDVFDEGAKVWWCFKGQTMEVMDINSNPPKMYKFSAVSNHKTSATLGDFWKIEKPLSTNDGDSVVSSEEVPAHFYVSYRENGEQKREVLNLNMDLTALPHVLLLYRYDPEDNSDRFLTDDFRGFIASLIDADKKAKKEMEKTDYRIEDRERAVEDYMVLMKRYTHSRYKNIDYTYKELKLLLKL